MTDAQKFSLDLATWKLWCFKNGFLVEEGEGWRPDWVQYTYYCMGFSQVEHGGKHTSRLAHDFFFWDASGYINFRDKEQGIIKIRLKTVGDFWKSLDPKNVWGGDWKSPFDPGHFERRI